jgi:Holliday junction resolvasome RuvABC endonuclease subunit
MNTPLTPPAKTDKIVTPSGVTRPPIVLAVDPGSRLSGLAVFEGTAFVHGRVFDFGYQRSRKKLVAMTRALMERQIRLFRPDVLAIESNSLWKNKNTAKLTAVSNEFRAVAREHKLALAEISPRHARLVVVGDGNAVKSDVAETICVRYPELSVHLDHDRYKKTRFWGNLYDACCVGLAYLIEQGHARRPRRPSL